MPRLGEILLQLELINEEQLHEALSAQVIYGGRLGTNLVEAGHLQLDQLAKALARRHRVPAALGAHFDRCDAAIQQRVPSEVAAKWRAVPIGRLAHDSRRLAIAVRDPLPEHGRGELAFHLDIDSEDLVQAIAPELRIHYHLELGYKIPRANRFLRVKSRIPTGLPVPPASVEETDLTGWRFERDASGKGSLVKAGEALVPSTPAAPPEVPRASSEDKTIDQPPVIATSPPWERHDTAVDVEVDDDDDDTAADNLGTRSDPALRLDDQGQPLVPSAAPSAEQERRKFVPSLGESSGTQATLARIAVRQVATDSAIRAVHVAPPRPAGPEELARTVRRADSRDKVGDLLIAALGELPGAPLDAAAILVVRPPLAIGWKGFCEEGPAAIESLAVPLDQPGVVADAYQAAQVRVVEVQPAAVTVVDERMWSVLGSRPPTRVLVAPIIVAEQVICLLYLHSRVPLGPAEALAITLADAAGTAFGRLLRAAQR